jgi:uncharacterized protein YoxC
MPTVDERLVAVEAKVEGIADLRRDMNTRFTELVGDVNGRFADVNTRFTELRHDMNVRFAEVNGRITELRGDMNGRFDEVNRRIGSLEGKVDRQFIWLMGMMVTGFIASIGALVGTR